MAKIGSLTADLKLESAAFIRDLTKASQATAQASTQMSRQMTALQQGFARASAAAKSMVAGFATIATVRSIARLGAEAIQTADEIATAATKIGIAGEELQRFRFAAAQADVETQQLDNALRLFAQNLATGKIAAEGQNMAEAFRNYIERIAEAPTQLEKVRLAQEAFGKQWQTAILLAAQGAEEFKQQADSAFVFSDKALAAAGKLDNQFRAIGNAIEAGFATGFIEEFGNALDGSDAKLKELNESAEAFGRTVASAFRIVIDVVSSFGREVAENQKQTAAYLHIIDEFRSGRLGVGDAVSGLLDPRGVMRQLSAIQQSTDWWRNAAKDANELSGAVGEATESMGQLGVATADAKMATESFWKAGMKIVEEPLAPSIQAATNVMQQFGQVASSAFANAIVDGEKFSDVLEALARDLEKMALNAFFQQIFGALIGSPTTAGSEGGGLLGFLFHAGGVVGRTGVQKRHVPAALFDHAPRLHKGLRAGEFPAILEAGEKVIPRGANDNVTINVFNNAPNTQARTRERQEADGSHTIDILIDQFDTQIGQRIIEGRSRIGGAFESAYGARRIAR